LPGIFFFEENPDRRRVPNGFGNGVYLKLEKMEEGSTLLKVALAAASFFASDLDTKPLIGYSAIQNCSIKLRRICWNGGR
jgi:hypothetical protein